MSQARSVEPPSPEELAHAWHIAELQLEVHGFTVVDRFGPSTYLTLKGGGLDTGSPYSPPEGHAGVWWAPWAVLARRTGARSKLPSLCHAPFGTPDDMRSIGRILARADGIIVFTHPDGTAFALIEDRVVQKAQLDRVAMAKWISDTHAEF